MSIALRHAWLQKHESPAASRGEFHWYPPDLDRELRASLVERARGLEPPAVLWELAPGRVAWAQVFAATAPTDGRRYTGLVVTIAEASGASLAALLAEMETPPAAPWLPDTSAASVRSVAASQRELAAIARGLLAGGTRCVEDPGRPGLHHEIARVERLLPATLTRGVRTGVWARGAAPEPDRVSRLVAEACAVPTSRAAQAWSLLVELATAGERTVDELVAEVDLAADPLVPAERAVIGPTRDLATTLHAWGRGRLDAMPTAPTLADRLADAVVRRALAELLDGRDPARAIAEARWHALLPAAQRTELLRRIAQRATTLRPLVEVSHA